MPVGARRGRAARASLVVVVVRDFAKCIDMVDVCGYEDVVVAFQGFVDGASISEAGRYDDVTSFLRPQGLANINQCRTRRYLRTKR